MRGKKDSVKEINVTKEETWVRKDRGKFGKEMKDCKV